MDKFYYSNGIHGGIDKGDTLLLTVRDGALGWPVIVNRDEFEVLRRKSFNDIGLDYYNAGKMKEAFDYFNRAWNEEEIPVSLRNLGYMYENGYYVERDYSKARELYEQAESEGYKNIASDIMRLDSLQKNVNSSDKVRGSKEHGKESLFDKGLEMFKAGKMKEARNYFRQSWEKEKNPAVLWYYGYMYEHGEGYRKDLKKAYSMYRWAFSEGYEAAKSDMLRLEKYK